MTFQFTFEGKTYQVRILGSGRIHVVQLPDGRHVELFYTSDDPNDRTVEVVNILTPGSIVHELVQRVTEVHEVSFMDSPKIKVKITIEGPGAVINLPAENILRMLEISKAGKVTVNNNVESELKPNVHKLDTFQFEVNIIHQPWGG